MRDVIETTERTLELSGVKSDAVKKFTIETSAKAFKVLINTIYSDKFRAIAREIMSNAYDAHVAAGIPDRAFKVDMPTTFKNEFRVRDYGVSLTHDEVLNLYTTVFKSTKEDSNNEVGKFGLGSKTPFAYVDNFTVTAWKDGEKRVYNAFIAEDGSPSIALFHREPSDEERGFEVSLPVELKDIKSFITATEYTLFGFPVKPELNVKLKTPELKVITEGDGWKIFKRNEIIGKYEAHLLIKQGCVLYPVDVAAIETTHGKAVESVRALRNEMIIIEMPIGTVDITPSRESLSYDPITVKNIIAKTDEIVQAFVVKIQAKIDECETPYDAYRVRIRATNNLSSMLLARLVRAHVTHWRNRKMPDQGPGLSYKENRRLKELGMRMIKIKKKFHNVRPDSSAMDNILIRKVPDICDINIDDFRKIAFTKIDLNNINKRSRDRLKRFAMMRPEFTCVIGGVEPNSYAMKRFLVSLMRMKIEFVSVEAELEKASTELETMFVEKNKPSRARIRLFDGNISGNTFEHLKDPSILNKWKRVRYVTTVNDGVKFGDTLTEPSVIYDLWQSLCGMGFVDESEDVLIGIPISRKDFHEQAAKERWINFEEEIMDMIGEIDINLAAQYATKQHFNDFRHVNVPFEQVFFSNVSKTMLEMVKTNGFWKETMEVLSQFKKESEQGEIDYRLIHMIGYLPEWQHNMANEVIRRDYRPHKIAMDVITKLEQIKVQYPLMFTQNHMSETMIPAYADYIEMMDMREAADRQRDMAWD